MDINDLSKEIEKLPKAERESILKLIDIKINSDMEKFISEIRSIKNEFGSKFESKFESIESKFESVENKFENKFESTNSRLSTVFWVIGIIGVVMSVMLTILTLKN